MSDVINALIAEFPGLVVGRDVKIAAKNIRKMLAAAYPAVKFSVRLERFAGGNSIDIDYIDGPIARDVEELCARFKRGYFDGMDDSYKYNDDAFCEVFGAVKYLSVNRKWSDEVVAEGIEIARGIYGDANIPSVERYRSGDAYMDFPAIDSDGFAWPSLIRMELSKLAK